MNNPNGAARAYNLSVTGLAVGWYDIEKSAGILNPHESENIQLNVNVPQDCGAAGTYALNVSSLEGSAQASLEIGPAPDIRDLSPKDSSIISSTEALISYRTSSNATGKLYLRSDNATDYEVFESLDGLLHAIQTNLTRNTGYGWYVKSCSACGCAVSENRSLYVDNGVVFTQKTYSYTVERDYNQHTTINVRNTDTKVHELLLEVNNSYSDLIVGFTGNGSVDQNVTVPPGETVGVDFMVHAQDAVLGEYDIPVSLKNLDADNISDNAVVHVSVRIPNINFTVTEVAVDNHTLAKTYEIRNYGDTLTDLMVYADDSIKSNVTFNPVINHGKLDSGVSTRFEVIPTLYANFTNISGLIYAKDPETVISAEYAGSVPEGSGVFPVLIDDGELCVDISDWYCTNKPNIGVRFGLPWFYDTLDVYDGELFTSFTPYSGVQPHSVFFGMNGQQIGSLENMIPAGPYNFSFPGSYMHGGSNVLGINTVHLNGGHYVVAADKLV
ncbi:MAG: hypothetical protein WAX07_01990 [Candidatus Altiarchaeia archaeon]